MQKIIDDWKANKDKKEDANYDFIRSLKGKGTKKVDTQAQRLHQETFEKIDCLTCGNCCKVLNPLVTKEDIKRISSHLNLKKKHYKINISKKIDLAIGK